MSFVATFFFFLLLRSSHPNKKGMMGTYGPPMLPYRGPDGLVSMPGMPLHPMGVPILPYHLPPPGMRRFPGMPYLGKNGFLCACHSYTNPCSTPAPPTTRQSPLQLLPVCQTNSLEGLPVSEAQVLHVLT